MLQPPENIAGLQSTVRYLPACLPKYPARAEFSALTKNLLHETSAILLATRADGAYVAPLHQKSLQNHPHLNWYLRKLRHPLSPRAIARTTIDAPALMSADYSMALAKRTDDEKLAAAQFGTQLIDSLRNTKSGAFIDCLERIASHVAKVPMLIRTKPATIQPDIKGVGWNCLASNEIPAALEKLHRYLLLHHGASPLLTAIVAIVMLSAIHPFADGNGRVSRVVFHSILHDSTTNPKLYFPFKQIYRMSDCGFEIRLRLAFLNADWQSVTHYLCYAIQFILTAPQNNAYRPAKAG
jgi:hypothetical protein